MGLDNFKEENSSTNTSQSDSSSSEPEKIDYEVKEEHKNVLSDIGGKKHISSKKNYQSEYDEDYLKECWNCGWRSIRLEFLSELGDVWFCTNTECRNSAHWKANNEARATSIAKKLDTEKLHRFIANRHADPSNMGLDKFKKDDSNSSSSTSSNNSSSSSSDNSSSSSSKAHGDGDGGVAGMEYVNDSDVDFYGSGDVDLGVNPMERKGALSKLTGSELVQSASGTIEISDDNAKLYLPMFCMITADNKYKQGERYKLEYTSGNIKPEWDGRVVSCMSSIKTELGDLNKEMIMFDVGSPSKKRVMDSIESKLGGMPDGDTEVYMTYFGDVMFMRDMAQASELFREGDLVDIEQIGNRVFKKNMLRLGIESKEDNEGEG